MDINKVISLLRDRAKNSFDVYERRPGNYQLIVPILHEDGDMVDIYLQDSPLGENYIRVCDFGMTLMRLSYTYEINSPTREQIFENILLNNGISNDEGNLYLDTTIKMLYESILQFAGGVQKICNMRYWSKEIIRSTFYEDLAQYTKKYLTKFEPQRNFSPLIDYEIISVDWSLTYNNKKFYLFGVLNNDKAKNTAIALLECKKAKQSFISLVVHENMEELGRNETAYLTKNADKQYPKLDDFQETGTADIERIAA